MSKCNTCSGGVHIREIKESQNVTRLAGQVVILDRHFIISLHAPTLYTKWRQLLDKCIFMFNFQMIFCSPCFCNFYPKVFFCLNQRIKAYFKFKHFHLIVHVTQVKLTVNPALFCSLNTYYFSSFWFNFFYLIIIFLKYIL